MDKSGIKQLVRVLLVLGGIILGVVSFSVIRPKFTEKTVVLTNESMVLLSQLNQLNDLEKNEKTYVSMIEKYDRETQRIVDKYPAGILEEDVILYAEKMIGKRDMKIAMVGIGASELLLSLNESEEQAANLAGSSAPNAELGIMSMANAVCPDYNLYGVVGSYDLTVSYDDLKTVVGKVLKETDKRNVPSLAVNFDSETGLLVGNMNLNFFYMTGTDKIYHEPDAGVIVKGVENIFGTLEPKEETGEEANENTGKKKNKKKN